MYVPLRFSAFDCIRWRKCFDFALHLVSTPRGPVNLVLSLVGWPFSRLNERPVATDCNNNNVRYYYDGRRSPRHFCPAEAAATTAAERQWHIYWFYLCSFRSSSHVIARFFGLKIHNLPQTTRACVHAACYLFMYFSLFCSTPHCHSDNWQNA